MPSAPRRLREPFWQYGWWLVPLLVCVWFRQLDSYEPVGGPGVDESWRAVKGWELCNNVRLGVESIFTYGRLGWLHDAQDFPPVFAWKFWAFEIVFKLLLCGVCVAAVPQAQGWRARLVFALALLSVSAGLDALALLALLALFQRLRTGATRREFAWLVVGALLVQVKFTYVLLFGAGVALAALAFWIEVSWRRALLLLVRAAGAFLFAWLLFGQSPADLGAWLQSSWWIARGYNEAMSAAGPTSELVLALAMLAGVLVLLVLERPRLALLVLGTVLLAWRTAFTRQIGNADVFFSVAPAAVWFTFSPRTSGRVALALRCALLAAGTWGLTHSHPLRDASLGRILERHRALSAQSLRDLFHPEALRRRLDERYTPAMEQWALPRTVARVGEEPLDVFQDSQGIAFLNNLHYRPRPVFQSYSAYTPELCEANRAFYAGERAPRFVLYRQETIDGRLVVAEDAPALAELLLRYRPVLHERGWLLLEREDDPPRVVSTARSRTRSVEPGEWIEIGSEPGDALELRLDPRLSARGELESALLRGPALECEFERADGSRGRARLVPGCARAGFLVRPFLDSQELLEHAFLGERVAGLKRLRVLAPEGDDDLWEAHFEVTLAERDGLLPPPRPQLVPALLYDDFTPPPTEVSAPQGASRESIGDHTAHAFLAPAAMRWRLEPGHYRLTASYGMLERAWKDPDPSDGALVFVALHEGHEVQQIYRRLLDPLHAVEDRGSQPIDVEFDVREPADLYLRMRTGWHDNDRLDWVFWEHVEIERR